MKATLITDFKDVSEDGSIIQMTIRRVPMPSSRWIA
jgi:hypothetical protein